MALTAFMGVGLVAGPVHSVAADMPCALPRTDAHHSLGLDTWNASYPRPEGTLDAALLFLSFPDATPMATPQELVNDHFPATSDFFQRASYGKFRLRPRPVDRWIELPRPATEYGIQRDWDPDLRNSYLRDAVAAADPHVDFGRYDIVYLVADPDAPGVDPDATKVVNLDKPLTADGVGLGRLVTVFEQSPPDRNVLAHETGHLFDLPDLYQRPSDGKADWDTRVGDWDLMGSQFGLAPEPFGWHKWKLGWLDRSNVVCVPTTRGAAPPNADKDEKAEAARGATAQARYTLRPLAAASRAAQARRGVRASVSGAGAAAPATPAERPDGVRLLVLRTGEHRAVAMEVRERKGNDRGSCAQGLLIYRVTSDTASTHGPVEVVDGHPGTSRCHETSVHSRLADAPLGVGESWSDPRNGLRVEVTGRTADGDWQVRLIRG
ncbi:M6 family metalloprotease domain-containing protein [Streptomyces smyrnaeus]|uniref:M6 family metalloprotease domain-containing protein n=1 Tax=Streptomyces smyrnaeus TaxID=1387713 RepID=A0ABS3Y1I4_9ACTN|nr:M6 family metalloprotease domain-containing protein [Streptomyces smyrnaeus]MBO8201037.1 M6 family metalloprotease domain-containing protein [Streptomyces smyrnaeus]